MGNKLDSRIETWKKLLLDTGRKNRLINFKESKRSNVKITNPSYTDLYNFVVVQEKEVVFPYASKVHISGDGEEIYDTLKSGNVETSKPIGELQKTLKVLRYKANTAIEEQGINILYLAFGLLKWTERDDSNEVYASPLILVPVKLSIESLVSPYKLSLYDDDIVVNPTLSHKLDNDFSIKLPEFDNVSNNIEAYFDTIEDAVKQQGWTVERCVNLTNLSFLKINMYKDLERNREKLQANQIIAAIAGEGVLSFNTSDEVDNFDYDNNIRPIDTFQVVDADSSQQDAILLSKKGVSFVLQGPPGTGKSQTITNIISEALAEGKKVLFVSEKLAALQVVYKRLEKAGLSKFCFTLHNYKANKKEILKELDSTISIDRKKVRDEVLAKLDMLERKRSELNDYQKELHTPYSALNVSVFEINGRLSKLENAENYIFDIEDVENVTLEQVENRKYLLSELARAIGPNGEDCTQNVWRGAKVSSLSNRLRHDIDATINHVVPILYALDTALSECSRDLGISCQSSLGGLNDTVDLLKIASKSLLPLKKWVYDKDLKQLQTQLSMHKALFESLLKYKSDVTKDFDQKILELDFYPLLQKFRNSYSSIFRIFKREYRNDMRLLESFMVNGTRLSYDMANNLFDNLKMYKEKQDCISKQENELIDLYGSYYQHEDTNWSAISKAVRYAQELKCAKERYNLPESFVEKLCEDRDIIVSCKNRVSLLTAAYDSIRQELDWFFSLFDNQDSFKNCSLVELASRLTECGNKKQSLEEWIDFKINWEKCNKAGLSSYLCLIEKDAIGANMIVDGYFKRFYRLWLDAVLPHFPAVQKFRGRIQDQSVKDFCELDREQFAIAQARVRNLIVSRIPDFNSITSARDEIGILKRELTKHRKLMPLRKLFMEIPNLVTTLKPCFMMSPLSVSVFLEAKSYDFDLVIFDEASQVHTEDAIGAIMRGKQVIIVGDNKQLPPTDFFTTTLNEDYDMDMDEYDDANAYDSILDEAMAVLPERSLRWHYRSRHEHLIAFSNAKIYNNRLITFPSAINKAPDYGVEYVYVADGVYDRGGKKNNIAEAKRVADLVFEHFKKYPKRSLGVVTFSEAQQAAVDMAIRQKRHENSAFEQFFVEDKEEAFFIKNLENVQGDERDTIIFSIGYAKDYRGVMYMNFGPLSREGGYRRLNVAITRAKYNVKLVGSIMPCDIDIDHVSSEGVKMLRSYIEFAQQGIEALHKEASYSSTTIFDSPFEESVYNFLRSKGYDVYTQVGCSGYRIDMAIKHPSHSGEFAIGIECDGASYHSSRTARERDRLRQGILEDMGWHIYRIWSTDWIKNPKEAEDKLIEMIEYALANPKIHAINNSNEYNSQMDIEEPIKKEDSINTNSGFIDYVYAEINELQGLSISSAVKRVIEIEQPIHFDELCRRVAPLFGKQKATSYVVDKVKFQIEEGSLKREVSMDRDLFITIDGFANPTPRKSTASPRKIEYISKEELIEAMKIIIARSFGITPHNLCVVTAKEFGYKRVSDNILGRFEKAYKTMLETDVAKEIEGKVVLL